MDGGLARVFGDKVVSCSTNPGRIYEYHEDVAVVVVRKIVVFHDNR